MSYIYHKGWRLSFISNYCAYIIILDDRYENDEGDESEDDITVEVK